MGAPQSLSLLDQLTVHSLIHSFTSATKDPPTPWRPTSEGNWVSVPTEPPWGRLWLGCSDYTDKDVILWAKGDQSPPEGGKKRKVHREQLPA